MGFESSVHFCEFNVIGSIPALIKNSSCKKKKFDIFKKICYNIYVRKIVKKTVAATFVNALGAVCRGFDSHIPRQYGGISSVGRATMKIMLSCIYSPLAQMVEQQTVNLWVAGSSPAGGASPGR